MCAGTPWCGRELLGVELPVTAALDYPTFRLFATFAHDTARRSALGRERRSKGAALAGFYYNESMYVLKALLQFQF